MLQVDNRQGSMDIVSPLRSLGVEVEVTRLDYGDIAWLGYGMGGKLLSISAELKRWSDLIACIQSSRFAGHQLPGLLKSYDHVWLLIYGSVRTRRDGVMEELRPNHRGGEYWYPVGGGGRLWMTREVESYLLSMQVFGAVRVQRVETLRDAAMWIRTAYSWYQKPEHKSHLAMYSKELYPDQALLIKPPLVRRVAAELPQIGLKRSADVARQFKTVLELAQAEENDWCNLTVDGNKQLGVRGSTVWKAIRGYGNKNRNGKRA